jgi:hypothetical protein
VNNERLRVKESGGRYFHYGHALHPDVACRKLRSLSALWHPDAEVEEICQRPPEFYEGDHKVKPFRGKHPAVMRDIVAAANWTYTSRNPLIRFRRKYFWNDLALLVQHCTGLTLGVHKNYRVVK